MIVLHTTSDAEVLKALARAKSQIPGIEKSRENFFGGTYITLDQIQEVVDPILADEDLYVSQWPDTTDEGKPAVTTLLFHTKSGDYISSTAALVMTKSDPQAQGSAITYMKRYAYVSMLGIKGIEADDDGNRASLPDSKITTAGTKAKEGGNTRELTRLRKELEAVAKRAGFTQARLVKGYHDKYGVDYKTDTDDTQLAAAVADITSKLGSSGSA